MRTTDRLISALHRIESLNHHQSSPLMRYAVNDRRSCIMPNATRMRAWIVAGGGVGKQKSSSSRTMSRLRLCCVFFSWIQHQHPTQSHTTQYKYEKTSFACLYWYIVRSAQLCLCVEQTYTDTQGLSVQSTMYQFKTNTQTQMTIYSLLYKNILYYWR